MSGEIQNVPFHLIALPLSLQAVLAYEYRGQRSNEVAETVRRTACEARSELRLRLGTFFVP